jgi:hypothetical protein
MISSEDAPAMPLLKLMHILGYAGLIPFGIPVCLMLDDLWFGSTIRSGIPWVVHAPDLFISYSAIILSFMCGTLWAGWQTIGNNRLAKGAVLLSNLLALSGWGALLLMLIASVPKVFCVILRMFGFISLLTAERRLGPAVMVYWRMRLSLTTIVLILHLIMITLVIMEF